MCASRRSVVAGGTAHAAVPPGARDPPSDYRLKVGDTWTHAVVVDVAPDVLDIEHDGGTSATIAMPVLAPALIAARVPQVVADSGIRDRRQGHTEHGDQD